MKVLSVLLLASLAAVALSACPNACSGHGTCNEYDECTCYNEGKSTYFGAMYDTAKGYDRIKQDALRAEYDNRGILKTSEQVYTNEATNVPSGTTYNGISSGDKIVQLSALEVGRSLGKDAFIQKAYTGPDCSQLTCPRGVSIRNPYSMMGENMYMFDAIGGSHGATATVTKPSHNVCRHADFAECSDAGMCDRNSGECQCLEGYEGAACQRTSCQNGCSGHGTCQSNIEFSKDGSLERAMKSGTPPGYWDMQEDQDQVDPRKWYLKAWDSGVHFGCKCDLGFRGTDCSQMECPSSTDPLGWYGNSQGEDCSGRGMCDYSSGECQCFAGFSGKDCSAVDALA